MKDFLLFRKMIAPILIQIAFWVAVIVFIYTGILDLIYQSNWLLSLEILILGPIVARLVCEVLLLLFRINERVSAIAEQLVGDVLQHDETSLSQQE